MSEAGEQIRDRFLALWQGGDVEGAARLVASSDAAPTTRLQGLSLSYFPTARFKLLRFVEAAELGEAVRSRFARPCPALPELAAAFVDPEELSYRSFENIVGLDRLFAGEDERSIRFGAARQLGREVTRMSFRTSESLAARLAQLDALGLYARPFDPSRGGLRFIFHSAELAAALTGALREALPAALLRGFVHVNPVFRCNRFEPGDAPFAAHVDSPYYDRSRQHVSKYTLLLYLTPGRGEVLRFVGGPTVAEIEGMTAVLFPQELGHEGRPYVDGRKVFLRTELVFEDPKVEHAPGIAEVFAKACYLGSESVFSPQLAGFAHKAYDAAAAAHWRGPPELFKEEKEEEPYLHKQFRGAHFVTNGYDYWFHRGSLELVEAAALALLDLLNAQIGGEPFRKECRSTVLVREAADRGWIDEFLGAQAAAPEPVFARLNKPALFPEPEQPLRGMDLPSSPDFSAEPYPEDWDATRHEGVLEEYGRARQWAMRRIFAAPITMLGKELFLDPARFVVVGDKVHVLSRERLGPVHFAGAAFFSADDFVGVDVTLEALQPLVPPISFCEDGETLRLRCDLFRNSWMVSHFSETVPVPRVLDGRDVDPESTPWLTAASLSREQLRAETGDEKKSSANGR